jgi:exosortase/archaeosortase family protein
LFALSVKFQREWLLLLGSLLVAAALYNHYMGHSVLLLEIIMVAVGTALAIIAAKAIHDSTEEKERGLITRLLMKIMPEKLVAVLIPTAGFVILLGWSAYKLFVMGENNMRMEDFIVTLFGLSLVLYNLGPSRLHLAQDFAVLYLLFMTVAFVIIWRAYEVFSGESHYRITSYTEFYIVTSPVAAILNALGFNVHALLDFEGLGLSNIIEYWHNGVMLRVGIGSGCSGLYSTGLFFSAFLAFVFVRYQRLSWQIGASFLAGFAVTWLSNIIRMIITVWAGIMWGHPALAFVHSYIGIVIFVVFITIFWVLIVRWLDKVHGETGPLDDKAPQTVSES